MKKTILLLALATLLTACGEDTEQADTKEEVVVEEPAEQSEVVEEIKDEPEEVVEEKNENISNEDTKTLVTAYIKGQFENMCDVSTETIEGTFVIHMYPKDTELKTEIAGLMLDKSNPHLLEGWNQMSKGLAKLSKDVNEQIGDNVSIMLHNPVNTENVLLVTINDVVFSDFTKEQ